MDRPPLSPGLAPGELTATLSPQRPGPMPTEIRYFDLPPPARSVRRQRSPPLAVRLSAAKRRRESAYSPQGSLAPAMRLANAARAASHGYTTLLITINPSIWMRSTKLTIVSYCIAGLSLMNAFPPTCDNEANAPPSRLAAVPLSTKSPPTSLSPLEHAASVTARQRAMAAWLNKVVRNKRTPWGVLELSGRQKSASAFGGQVYDPNTHAGYLSGKKSRGYSSERSFEGHLHRTADDLLWLRLAPPCDERGLCAIDRSTVLGIHCL